MKHIVFLLFFKVAVLATPVKIEEFCFGNRQFAAAIYKQIARTNKGNVVFSPFSVETVLSLISEGAKGETRRELVAALHLPDTQDKIRQMYKEVLPKLNLNNSIAKLLAANKIYANSDVQLESDFKKTAVKVYNSGIENVNLTDHVDAANTINQWVEKQTNEKIKNIVKPGQIHAATDLIIVNTLYFNSWWQNVFSTTNDELFFHTATKRTVVPTMQQNGYYNYYHNYKLDAKFLKLNYAADGLSMVLALPNEIEGLADLENNILDVFEPQPWTEESVSVKLPKFSIDSEIQFVDILKSVGIIKIFDAAEADLTGVALNRKELFVSNVVQKAFINVTETGTEASAASVGVLESRFGFDAETDFFADHPFIFVIKYLDIILFAGRYS